MVPKIVSYAVSIVARNEKDSVRVLGGEFRSKIKRHSHPVSFSGSFTKVSATRLPRLSRTARNNRAQRYVTHFWKIHDRLLPGN